MRNVVGRIGRSALWPSIGANVAGQLAAVFAQLAVVPAFAIHWGAARYGVWLMLFAIPSALAMADLGFATAAGNDMMAQVARGERADARATYRAVRAGCLGVGAVALLLVALVLAAAPGLVAGLDAVTEGRAATTVLMFAGYGALALQNGVSSAGLRATGGYAIAGVVTAGGLAGEAAGALLLVGRGWGLVGVAGWYFAARGGTAMALAATLRWRAPWLGAGRDRLPIGRLRRLWRPALAAMALPVAQAIAIQGTVLALGWARGSAAVPAFVAVRTLSRVAIQAILLVNHALMPATTAARAMAEHARVAFYARLSGATALALAVPGAALLLVAGPWLVQRWTGGALHPGPGLVAAMASTMILNACWQPASNLLLAINAHEGFAWRYLATTLAGVALCLPLCRWLGSVGAAMSLLVVDGLMLRFVSVQFRASGLPDMLGLWRAPRPHPA